MTFHDRENHHALRLDAIDDAVRAKKHLTNLASSHLRDHPTRVRREGRLLGTGYQLIDPGLSRRRIVSGDERGDLFEVGDRRGRPLENPTRHAPWPSLARARSRSRAFRVSC